MRGSLLIAVLAMLIVATSAFGAKPEFRGAWVTAWVNGFLTSAQADETIRLAKLANMNALIVQVRKTGDAFYKSNLEPRASLSDPNYDPLAYLIKKAHREGIEIHAWVNTFRVTARGSQPKDPKHVVNLHPDWVSLKSDGTPAGSEGKYLDPGVPAAQDWTHDVFLDIVKNYDVDGIHFDYVRYPSVNSGYSAISVARFNSETGNSGRPDPKDLVWCAWRRRQVTDTVRRIYEDVKKIKPKVQVTTSVIAHSAVPQFFSSTEAYKYVMQDWAGWTKAGIVDALIPMNYRHGSTYAAWLDGMKRWRGDRQAYSGLCVALDSNSRVDLARSISEIKLARQHGVEGVSLFYFNQSAWREDFCKKARAEVWQEAAPTPERKSWVLSPES